MRTAIAGSCVALALVAGAAGCGGRGSDNAASGKNPSDPGITKTSIKLGGTFARSGPVAAAGEAADGGEAAIDRINAAGGVNGRKLKLLVEDDQYDPTVALDKTRKLIDQDKVFAMCCSVGTAAQLGARSFFAQKKVPNLFLYTGAGKWKSENAQFPYSTTGVASYPTIGRAYGQYLAQTKPDAKVAVLYQNDDLGHDHLSGFKEGIKGSNIKIVAQVPYEVTTPTTAPLVSKLKRSGADVFFDVGSPQGASQALKQVSVLGWKPLVLFPATGVEPTLLKAAGQAGIGAVSEAWWKDPANPKYKGDPDVVEYLKWMKQAAPKLDPNGRIPITGYINMNMMIESLKTMKTPTREGLLKAAQNLDADIPMLAPGIKAKTGPGDPLPIEALQLQKWNGSGWSPIGQPIDTSSSGA